MSEAAAAPTIPNRGMSSRFATTLTTKAITERSGVHSRLTDPRHVAADHIRPAQRDHARQQHEERRDGLIEAGQHDREQDQPRPGSSGAAETPRDQERRAADPGHLAIDSSRGDPATCGKKRDVTALGKKKIISARPTAML